MKTRDANESEQCLVSNTRKSADDVQTKLSSSAIMTGTFTQCKQQYSLKEDYKYFVSSMKHDSEDVTQMDMLIRKKSM